MTTQTKSDICKYIIISSFVILCIGHFVLMFIYPWWPPAAVLSILIPMIAVPICGTYFNEKLDKEDDEDEEADAHKHGANLV